MNLFLARHACTFYLCDVCAPMCGGVKTEIADVKNRGRHIQPIRWQVTIPDTRPRWRKSKKDYGLWYRTSTDVV